MLRLISRLTVAAVAALGFASAGATFASPAANVQPDLHWRLVGPFRGGWGEMVEGVPNRPDTFYFAASGGGVWRSDDAGRTWRSLFDHGPSAAIGALAVVPGDGETVYIGAGQPEPRYDVSGGEGVFKTTDGGATWRSLGLEKTRHIGRIWVDPANPDHVLVAAVGDFFAAGPDRGVYRSLDGGKTWSQTLKIDDATGAVDLTADPKDPDTIFAAAWQARQYPWQSYFTPVAGPGSGVYKSTDGGATWVKLAGPGWPTGPLGRISLAATRTPAGLRVYAVVSATKASGLYRSDDGGASWTRVNEEKAFASYYASRVTVSPDDPDVVWLVGQSIRRCGDGGKTCEIVKGAPGGDDYHFVWINPAHPDHMANASDQGVVVSVDGGRTWSSWYNQPTGQFYHLATDNRFPYRIYSGQQDSGTVAALSRSDDGALTFRDWRPVGGDERDYDIPDPDMPDIVYSTGLGGRVSRWDARTGQVANIAPFLEPNYGERQTSTAHHFVWVTPMAVSRVGPTTLYLGGEVVFASRDRGEHWSIISPDLTGKAAGAQGCDGDVAVADAKACGYGGIWSMTASARHADELWVGTDDGLIQFTRDAGAHWTDITPPGVPAWAKISSIDPSPLQDGVAYAAIDNHRQGDRAPRVLATRDWGLTWRDATGDLPKEHYVAVVRADTVRTGLLYAGTDVGAYVSNDDGAHWRRLATDLPTATVNDLLVHGDDLIAATQGRGLWVLDDVAPLREVEPTAASADLRLFTPATAARVRDNNNHDTPAPPEEPAGRNPPPGALIDYWIGPQAKAPVTLEIRDAAGALVRRLSSEPTARPDAEIYFAKAWINPPEPLPMTPGMHRIVWDLRYDRPTAISYDYSIATAAGRDTPITPGGPYAPPGRYTVTLSVGGKFQTAPLTLVQDPRTHIADSDFAASLALSQRIGAALAQAWRGAAEMAAVHAQLARSTLPAAAAMARKTATGDDSQGFARESGILTGIETDLESADLAPTQPQLDAAGASIAKVEALWAEWTHLRDGELADLNATLVAAHQRPIVVPPLDKLSAKPPEGGEDLP